MQLLPRDEKFFDLLVEQANIALNAANVLANGMGSNAVRANARETAREIRDLKRQGDEALRKTYRRLHKTFITPIDPEDVHELASSIEEILEHLDATAYRFDAFGLERCPERMTEIAGMAYECVKATIDALLLLQREGVRKPDELTSLCEEIERRELETEDRVREVIRDLFANERDAIELIRKKEIYELLESTADCCEDVANALEAIAVKNS